MRIAFGPWSIPLFEGPGPWAVTDDVGHLLAMYEPNGDMAKPVVVVPEMN